jgi:hypothetical protein
LNQIPFGFGLFQNSGQLSALSHPLKDKSNFTTESAEENEYAVFKVLD